PVKNSSAAIRRRPSGPATSRVAPRHSATAGSSADGSAWAREPHTVPRLRISRCPTHGSAWASSGTSPPAVRSTWRWRTAAPHAQRAAVVADLAEFGHAGEVDQGPGPAEPHGQDG